MPDEPSSPHSPPKNAGPISQKIAVGADAAARAYCELKKHATNWGECLWAHFEKLIERKSWLVLIVASLVWLIPGNNLLPLVDRDEPRFAFATEEMLARQAGGDAGAWVVPTFNNVGRFDKPPLVYWWMRLHYTFGGYNDFAARLHSVVAMLGCVMLVWAFARRLYTPAIGFWSAFAFLTSLQIFEHGRLCVADAAMLLFTLTAMWATYELLLPADKRYGIFKRAWVGAGILWLSLALGFATKWIVPMAVVGTAVAGYAALTRRWPNLKDFKPLSGGALFVVLTLAWVIPAWIATHGEFFTVGLGEHVFRRGADAMNARAYNPLFYCGTILVSLLPWIAGIGGIFGWLKSNWSDREKFLVAWGATTLIMFSLAKTQLPHYIMPAFAPLLILIVTATGLKAPTGRFAGWFFKGYYALLGALVILAGLITLTVAADGPAAYAKLAGVAGVAALAGFLGLGWGITHRKGLLSAASFLLVPLAFACAGAALREVNPAIEVRDILTRTTTPDVLIATGFEEPSLTAYTQRNWIYQPLTEEALKAYAAAPSAALLVQSREIKLEAIGRVWLKLPTKGAPANEKLLTQTPPSGGHFYRIAGVNMGHFSWTESLLYIKP